jgi:hypothetical protein
MGVLTLRCSATGREFSTGLHIEDDTFSTFPATGAKVCCPYCGREARWVNSLAGPDLALRPAELASRTNPLLRLNQVTTPHQALQDP